jgi:nucleoid DNA-binding protein
MAAKKSKKGKITKKTAKKTVAKTKKCTGKTASKKSWSTQITGCKNTKKVLTVRSSGFEKTSKTRSKGQVLTELSTSTGLSKKELGNVFENLTCLMQNDLTKGPGSFQIPGLIKVVVVRKPATPARRGINPFNGEEMTFKAKPARNVVRARPLKGLKDMVK